MLRTCIAHNDVVVTRNGNFECPLCELQRCHSQLRAEYDSVHADLQHVNEGPRGFNEGLTKTLVLAQEEITQLKFAIGLHEEATTRMQERITGYIAVEAALRTELADCRQLLNTENEHIGTLENELADARQWIANNDTILTRENKELKKVIKKNRVHLHDEGVTEGDGLHIVDMQPDNVTSIPTINLHHVQTLFAQWHKQCSEHKSVEIRVKNIEQLLVGLKLLIEVHPW